MNNTQTIVAPVATVGTIAMPQMPVAQPVAAPVAQAPVAQMPAQAVAQPVQDVAPSKPRKSKCQFVGSFIINKVVKFKARYKKENGQYVVDQEGRLILDHFEAHLSVYNTATQKGEFAYQYINISENTEKYTRFLADTFQKGNRCFTELEYNRYNDSIDVKRINMRSKNPNTKLDDAQYQALFDYTIDQPANA